MKKNIKTSIIVLFIINAFTYAQNKEKKAFENFNDYAYLNAISSYKELVDKGLSNEEIYKNLGDANYLNSNYEEATSWYQKLFTLENSQSDFESMYRLAQSLKSIGDYSESNQWMRKFSLLNGLDHRAVKFSVNNNYLEDIKLQSGRCTINNLSINSSSSDFAPFLNNELLIFATARDTGFTSRKIHEWNKQPFLNLYVAKKSENLKFTTLEKLNKEINTKTHESSAIFTKDGTTVYFTRNNSDNGKFNRDKKGVSRLKIYKATVSRGEWLNIIELPFNSEDYSVAHPTLNYDETQLYFASDMPGTYGASDLFYVNINTDGTYGEPINLGKEINTESRETFPYVSESNVLYFSSDGHQGLGGLDLFAAKMNNKGFSEIVNLGEPINSQQDDFSFFIDELNHKGFFASNRKGGKGSDDIYTFDEQEPLTFKTSISLNGTVENESTNLPVDNVEISILDESKLIVAQSLSTRNGAFSFSTLLKEGSYVLLVTKKEYVDKEYSFIIDGMNDAIVFDVRLQEIITTPPIGTDLVKLLDIKPIYFDFDKAVIREDAFNDLQRIIEYLNEYPSVKIQIGSHTDSRAKDTYNLSLSEKRAKATGDYLIQRGIDFSRISYQGYGETKLTNDCSNEKTCSKEQHQLNRRAEFIVIAK